MPEPIIRQDAGGKHQQWQIDFEPELVKVIDPAGQVFLRWSPEYVAKYVVFPSFSKSIKYPGFRTQDGTFQFSLSSPQLKMLRALGNRGIAASGPKAARSVLIKAILWTVFGFGFMCLGVVMLTITVHELTSGESATTNNNPHPVGLVSTLVGFGVLCRGIYGFRQYSQIKKLTLTISK